MASKTYSRSERGGGRKETGRMRAAILNQINSWWRQAKWVDETKADRLHAKLNESPERFISPNPDANYREEASRIYKELKQDYNLRQETDLNSLVSEYDDRAERHYAKRDRADPENELGGAPEPTPTESDNPDPFTKPEPTPTSYPGYLGLVRLFTAYSLELTKQRLAAVCGFVSALYLCVQFGITRAETVARDRLYTLEVYGEYHARRLTQEPPESGRIAATNQP